MTYVNNQQSAMRFVSRGLLSIAAMAGSLALVGCNDNDKEVRPEPQVQSTPATTLSHQDATNATPQAPAMATPKTAPKDGSDGHVTNDSTLMNSRSDDVDQPIARPIDRVSSEAKGVVGQNRNPELADRNRREAASHEADNTGRNAVDRNDGTLTPMDQSEAQPDLDITAQIRKRLVAADGLSFSAINLKVITQEGRVTLRGSVENVSELVRVVEIANSVAGVVNIDNQVQVSE